MQQLHCCNDSPIKPTIDFHNDNTPPMISLQWKGIGLVIIVRIQRYFIEESLTVRGLHTLKEASCLTVMSMLYDWYFSHLLYLATVAQLQYLTDWALLHCVQAFWVQSFVRSPTHQLSSNCVLPCCTLKM